MKFFVSAFVATLPIWRLVVSNDRKSSRCRCIDNDNDNDATTRGRPYEDHANLKTFKNHQNLKNKKLYAKKLENHSSETASESIYQSNDLH